MYIMIAVLKGHVPGYVSVVVKTYPSQGARVCDKEMNDMYRELEIGRTLMMMMECDSIPCTALTGNNATRI